MSSVRVPPPPAVLETKRPSGNVSAKLEPETREPRVPAAELSRMVTASPTPSDVVLMLRSRWRAPKRLMKMVGKLPAGRVT